MSDGAILELVSRGKKDAYLNQDPVRSWFDSAYQPRSPATAEYRVVQTDNAPRFGQWFDISLPSEGDILTGVDVRITMPTWLPLNLATASLAILVAAPGRFSTTIGWPRTREASCTRARASASPEPPAAKPQIIRIGLFGKSIVCVTP